MGISIEVYNKIIVLINIANAHRLSPINIKYAADNIMKHDITCIPNNLLPLRLLPGYGVFIVTVLNTTTDTIIIHDAILGKDIYKAAEINISAADIR